MILILSCPKVPGVLFGKATMASGAECTIPKKKKMNYSRRQGQANNTLLRSSDNGV